MRIDGLVLNGNEAAEPLDAEHVIIQPVNGYRFGADAVALAHFAAAGIKRGERVFDLCSGCGIVGMLVAIETGACVVGAEIDAALCDMSVRAARANGLEAQFFNADIRDLDNGIFVRGGSDAVTCNPPFFKADSKARAVAPSANSEITVVLDDVVRAASRLLRDGGAFYAVYTASRLDEMLCACAKYSLMPKTLEINGNGKTFLLRAVKGGRQGMSVSIRN